MSRKRKCLGYGEMTGRCENDAGTPWTPYWCLPCDEERRATISRQLHEIRDDLAARSEGGA